MVVGWPLGKPGSHPLSDWACAVVVAVAAQATVPITAMMRLSRRPQAPERWCMVLLSTISVVGPRLGAGSGRGSEPAPRCRWASAQGDRAAQADVLRRHPDVDGDAPGRRGPVVGVD